MPADYLSTAQALSISPSPSPSQETAPAPPWVRPRTTSTRRLSTPFNRASNQPLITRTLRAADKVSRKLWSMYLGLTLIQRVAVAIALLILNVLGILFLVYSERIFSWLNPYAESWRALPGGWLILWVLTFATAFPPMIGYSSCASVAGFVYGFPLGWPIVATASVAGSVVAFATSRTVFSGYVHGLVGKDHRFVALGQVLRRDGLGMLTMIRFCPLPFSLSNGFLATIPSIQPWAFAVSTAFASPKLLVHVFIGSRLALLAEEGEKMSAGSKAVNYISMIVGGIVGLVVGLLIYNRTMARAAELAMEDAEQIGIATGEGTVDYADVEAGLLDPEDAAALMDDDDISLWENDAISAGYTDEEMGVLDKNGAKQGDISPGTNGNSNQAGYK